jgi:alpha-ketoglutarate-dependent taurine dioxygenase
MRTEREKITLFIGPPSSRRKVTVNACEMVESGYLTPESRFPLLLQPKVATLDFPGWIAGQRDFICQELRTHAAILFRGFGVEDSSAFQSCAAALSPELLSYTERAAPRQEVHDRVYTSTEYPADQCIPLHHEMSYSHMWPMKLWFYCAQPAAEGGCTPITDDRKVIGLIDERIRDEFLKKGVMYVRNFGEGADMPWQEVFQTEDRHVVEKYCEETFIEFEWRSQGRLRTRQVRQVMVKHPETGDEVWFNHAHLFHVSNLEPAVRQALLKEFRDDELPRNAFYGDGSQIPDATLEAIRRTYSDAAVRFPWRKGDLLLVDNILASHGRDSFSGERRTLVAMAETYTNPDLVSPAPRPAEASSEEVRKVKR